MFFHVNEKHLADIIANQLAREQQEIKDKEAKAEYDGHSLTFLQGRDGLTVIDAEPPLTKEVEDNPNLEVGKTDVFTSHGWVSKK
jgi:hypothetical protein